MLNFSEKQKIILALLITLTLVGFSLGKSNSLFKRTGFEEIVGSITAKFQVLAQQAAPYFFPRYPERLKYVVSEISEVSGKLIALNEKLGRDVEKCDCSQAQSQCRGGGPRSASIGGVLYSLDEEELNEEEETTCPPFSKTFLTDLEDVGSETTEEITEELEDLKTDLENLKNSIPDLEREIENLKTLEPDVKEALLRRLNELKGIITMIEGDLAAGRLEALKDNLAQLVRIGEERERQLLGILGQIKRELVNNFLSPFTGLKADFARLLSAFRGCDPGQVRTFGDPCPKRVEIKEDQLEISEKSVQLSLLKNLLAKEMETGLERELETLKPERAQELRTNLESVIQDSQELSAVTAENGNLPSGCSVKNCAPACQLGTLFQFEGCVRLSFGEQKPIKLKFSIGVGLENLKLGKVGINSVNLGLPDEIEVAPLEDLTITIPSQEIAIAFPPQETLPDLSAQYYDLSPAQLSLPKAPKLTLPCPGLPTYSSYRCDKAPEESEIETPALTQYFQTFTQLSDNCQKTLGPEPECLASERERINELFEPEIERCKKTVGCEAQCANKSEIEKPACIEECMAECQGRFSECTERCGTLPECGCDEEAWADECLNGCNPENLIQKRDEAIRKLTADLCKRPECFDPEKLGLGPAPSETGYTGRGGNCPSQTIGDYPVSRLSCPASLPTIPKIPLPDIIIPDIRLPEFKLLPFIVIHLPNFIFEDLILPDLTLCDIDECKNFFPNLSFRLPSLNLPSIRVPEAAAPEMGAPKVSLETVMIPPIPFNIPQLKELNLSSLMTPDLEIPKIPIPRPELFVKFEGIDADIAWALATFLLHSFGMPDFSFLEACAWLKASLPLPLTISFPDYYFYWPGIPDIPQIPYCKDINGFCRNVKNGFKNVTDKVAEIQNTVNKVFQKEIQEKLDKGASEIQGAIAGEIRQHMERVSKKIKEEVEKQYKKAEVRDGKIYIPTAFVRTDEFKKTIPLSEKIKISKKVKIPWPAALKKLNLTKPVTYQLPDIPLSKLSYSKSKELKGPGFQSLSLSVALKFGAECMSLPTSGGNPCPIDRININLGKIKNIQGKIDGASQKIIKILE